MIIDRLAYASRLRNINSLQKLIFAAAMLILCIAADSFVLSALTSLIMISLIIFAGKTNAENVFHLMTVPVVFIIMGTAAIAVSIGNDESAMLACFRMGGIYLGIEREGLCTAFRTAAKCFGAVSCMYFLSLTTPMIDLFTLLRKSVIPNFIVEIAELIYRYIFVLFDVSSRIHAAQDARLGYATLKTSYHSTASLASNIFMRAMRQAERTYTAMESRGYDGEINITEQKQSYSAVFWVFETTCAAFSAAVMILVRRMGI